MPSEGTEQSRANCANFMNKEVAKHHFHLYFLPLPLLSLPVIL